MRFFHLSRGLLRRGRDLPARRIGHRVRRQRHGLRIVPRRLGVRFVSPRLFMPGRAILRLHASVVPLGVLRGRSIRGNVPGGYGRQRMRQWRNALRGLHAAQHRLPELPAVQLDGARADGPGLRGQRLVLEPAVRLSTSEHMPRRMRRRPRPMSTGRFQHGVRQRGTGLRGLHGLGHWVLPPAMRRSWRRRGVQRAELPDGLLRLRHWPVPAGDHGHGVRSIRRRLPGLRAPRSDLFQSADVHGPRRRTRLWRVRLQRLLRWERQLRPC